MVSLVLILTCSEIDILDDFLSFLPNISERGYYLVEGVFGCPVSQLQVGRTTHWIDAGTKSYTTITKLYLVTDSIPLPVVYLRE